LPAEASQANSRVVNSAEILHYGSGVQHHNMNVWPLAGSDIGDVMGGGVLLSAGWPVDYDQRPR